MTYESVEQARVAARKAAAKFGYDIAVVREIGTSDYTICAVGYQAKRDIVCAIERSRTTAP